MSTATEISALLNSPAVQSISFSAEAVSIHGSIYRRLTTDIAAGRINILVGGTLLAGADAQYTSSTNTLELPRATIASLYEKQVIVHEMTHAATMRSIKIQARRSLVRRGEQFAI